jgi:hypothetical protein
MRLIFIYNANSGKVNAFLDGLHKLTSPATYNCSLCAITHGNFSENSAWKKFREQSGIEMVFYHKDEFLSQFKSKWLPKYDFPIVLSEENGALEIFVSANELDELQEVSQLIDLIKTRQFQN